MAKMKQILLDIAESQEFGEEDGFVFPETHPTTTDTKDNDEISSD